MKGIILHGGHGTRLRPLTHTGPKQLLPIANKPMSQYALEDLKKIGIDEIGIIIGNAYPKKVKDFYGDGSKFGVKISYIYQDQPKGISHAINLCQDFVGDDKFIVYLGDNILRKDLVTYATKFSNSNSDAMILLCKVDDPSRFGIVELDSQNKQIKKIIEKPKNPPTNLAVTGIYFLTPKIFSVIKNQKFSWRDELEITESLQLLLEQKCKIDYEMVTGWWKDTGTPEDILDANRLVLDSIGIKDQFSFSDYTINQNIAIGHGTNITNNSSIIGPVIIGKNCQICTDVRIGPYVSIGDNSVLKNCCIERSIIMDNCIIDIKGKICDSIIANGSNLHNTNSEKYQFLLGERSDIKF